MAISQNDPDNWPNNVYAYDPEPRGKTLTRTTFNWLTATVDRVWAEGQSFGIKFVEDPGGDIWNISGAWDDTTNRFLPYEGYQYKSEEKVDVQLSMRTYTKNDGSPGMGRAITKIRINNEYSRISESAPAEEAPAAAQEPAPQPVQEPVQEPLLNTNQRIAKAQCLNIMKDFYLAGEIEVLGLTKEAAKQIFRDENLRLAQGKAVDLSYLSSLVQAAIEKGGTVVEVKDSNNPDEQVEELQW
jgi:hypothetical protein